ncbi:DUF6538 domain-containing protein [Rhizobacter fulvus]
MNKTDHMAKLPGLYLRGGVWQLRVIIPLDLQGAYAGRSRVIKSLQTGDYEEAKSKAKALHADWDATFEQKRRELNPQRIETVTPEMSKALAERVAAALLRNDDTIRADPSAAALFLDALQPFRTRSSLLIPVDAPSPLPKHFAAFGGALDGLSHELAGELAEVNAGMDQYSAVQMALQRIATVLPMVKAEARSMGLEFDEKAPGALTALRESLKAYRRAMQSISARDQGAVIDTPEVQDRVNAPKVKAVRLRDVLPQWKGSKTRKPQTVQAAEKALALYEECTGNPPITTLTRSQGVDMRAFLLAGGVTAKTARDRFDYIKGFLNFASRELELLPRNPWEGLAIEYTTTTPRRPWSSEQLAAHFSRPLHSAYELPTAWEAGADAAYWVPLLGIFTGARISELCQLRTADVSTVDSVAVLRITDEGEGQGVKTEAGRRTVPVHAELVRLGFLDFVAAIRQAKSVQLFPALPLHKTKAGQYFSEWFASTRTLADGTKLPDFHSLRHTVRSKLASAGIAEPLIDTLIGHEVKGSTGARTYTMRSTEDLQRALSTLAYAGLALPKVFVKPAVVTRKPKRRNLRKDAE